MTPTDPAAYQWPEVTAATLLAGLAAMALADQQAWDRLAYGRAS